jgi:hypothetical protein
LSSIPKLVKKRKTNASSELRDSISKLQIYLLYKCVK